MHNNVVVTGDILFIPLSFNALVPFCLLCKQEAGGAGNEHPSELS